MEPSPPPKPEISEETRVSLKYVIAIVMAVLAGSAAVHASEGRVSGLEGRIDRIERRGCAIAAKIGVDVSIWEECQR